MWFFEKKARHLSRVELGKDGTSMDQSALQLRLVAAAAASGMTATAASGTASAYEAAAMLCHGLVAGVADVALAIASFIGLKMSEGVIAIVGQRAYVAVMRIEAVIDVAVETARTMEPGAGTDEDAAGEPVRAVVAVGCTAVWRVVEVAVRACGCAADIDADGNLAACRCNGCCG